MVVLPAATPVTTPVDELTVAAVVLLLLQVPPLILLERVVVEPVQTKVVPLMVPALGTGIPVMV